MTNIFERSFKTGGGYYQPLFYVVGKEEENENNISSIQNSLSTCAKKDDFGSVSGIVKENQKNIGDMNALIGIEDLNTESSTLTESINELNDKITWNHEFATVLSGTPYKSIIMPENWKEAIVIVRADTIDQSYTSQYYIIRDALRDANYSQIYISIV